MGAKTKNTFKGKGKSSSGNRAPSKAAAKDKVDTWANAIDHGRTSVRAKRALVVDNQHFNDDNGTAINLVCSNVNMYRNLLHDLLDNRHPLYHNQSASLDILYKLITDNQELVTKAEAIYTQAAQQNVAYQATAQSVINAQAAMPRGSRPRLQEEDCKSIKRSWVSLADRLRRSKEATLEYLEFGIDKAVTNYNRRLKELEEQNGKKDGPGSGSSVGGLVVAR